MLNPIATLVMQNLQLLMHPTKLLHDLIGALEATQIQEHRLNRTFTVDQHTTFVGPWLVRHHHTDSQRHQR